ncbi:MAG: uroporphyrinogen decarboxylase family protein [Lachnospiraceae bacterium]|nr:uroporphyrinogen decarboxylase family protein [Lachnospiraceae bacterium]
MIKYDITFHPKWWHKHAGICFGQEFFDDPKYRIECDVKMRKALYEHFGAYGIGEKNPKERPLLGSDLLAAGYLYSEILGCKIIYQEDNSPQVVSLGLDEDSLQEFEVPKLAESEVWKRTQKQIDYLQAAYGHVETYINLMGIQNIALDLMGQELLVSYYTAPDEVDAMLHGITEISVDIGKRFKQLSSDVSGGVTGIIRQVMPECYVTSNCSVEMVSNELYEEFLLKYDTRLSHAFGCFGIHHCGQTMEHVAEGYAKVPDLQFAEVGAGSDIQKVREILPHVHLNARYSPARILHASKEEITKEVQELVSLGKHDQGGISVSCVGMDEQVTDAQVINFLEACRAVGE